MKKFRFKNCQESKISCDKWYCHFKNLLYRVNASEFNVHELLNNNNDNNDKNDNNYNNNYVDEYFNIPLFI